MLYDVIVIGCGGMGSAAAWRLSQAGLKVLALEQFDLVHDRGSSHGHTRMIRKAYFEHSDYVPLLERSYELWDEAESAFEQELFVKNGLVIFGPKDSKLLSNIKLSSTKYNIPINELGPEDIKSSFPDFRPDPNHFGIFEPSGGYLLVEDCVGAFQKLALKNGADIRPQCVIESIEPTDLCINVKTRTDEFSAKKLVVTAGGWTSQLFKLPGANLAVHQNALYWFKCNNERSYQSAPCFGFERSDSFFYGFPQINGEGLKLANHAPGPALADPSDKTDEYSPQDLEAVSRCVEENLPAAHPELLKQASCIYTMSPDEHFVIDRLPSDPRIVLACGFSGHGFKFAPVIGEIISELVFKGRTDHPIHFLGLNRFKL